MYADVGWEYGIWPGFIANYMATTNGHIVGHCDQYQHQVALADAGLFSSSSDFSDVGSHVVIFLLSLVAFSLLMVREFKFPSNLSDTGGVHCSMNPHGEHLDCS